MTVGKRTHNMRVRWSSGAEVKKAAKAFQISAMAVTCCSGADPSSIKGAIFATYSMSAGRRNFAQSPSIMLPELDAVIRVLAQ